MNRWAQPSVGFGRPAYALAPAPAEAGIGAIGRGLAVATFAGLLAATIALNAFKIGPVPIRGLAAAGVLVLVALYFPAIARDVVRQHRLLLGLAGALGCLGMLVSLVNGAPFPSVLRGLVEVHLQAVATILVAAILARVGGARASALAIVGVVGASACVAAAQMLDIEAAWTVRRALGPLPVEELEGLNLQERRPTGLSYSPIQLSTHLCLAFAAFVAVRDKMRGGRASGADPLVLPALLAMSAAALACATRSPILGGLLFILLYALQRRTPGFALFLLLAAAIAYFVWPLLMGLVESQAPRVTRTDDNSASARSTLAYYGLRLLVDNPLGYGLTFAPMTLWQGYWPEIYMMQAPRGVRENDLHNYVVTMLNIYGVGLLLLAPIIVRLLRGAAPSLIFFTPYVVHIFFHNSGPFYNDNVIWFVLGAIAAVPREREGAAAPARRLIGSPLLQAQRQPRPRGLAPGFAP